MNLRAKAVAAVCAAGLGALAAGPAAAAGYVTVEGQIGFLFASPVVAGLVDDYVEQAYDPVYFYNFAPFAAHVNTPRSFGGRVEAGVTVPAAGLLLRLGTIWSGWGAYGSFSGLYHGVAVRNPAATAYFGFETICIVDDIGCALLTSSLTRRYLEMMPDVLVGGAGPGGATVLAGLRLFYGGISEYQASSQTDPPVTRVEAWLDGNAVGALSALEIDVPVGPRFHILLSGAVGGYALTASARSQTATFEGTFIGADTMGFRAQFGAGLSLDIGDTLSIGMMARADYWSAWPTLGWRGWTDGEDHVAINPLLNVTVGTRIGLRFGG